MSGRHQEDIGDASLSHANKSKNGRLEPKTDLISTEIDPCLDHGSDSKPRGQPFYEKHISNLQAKTGLSRKWVLIVFGLVLAIVMLVLVIVGLAIGWPTIPHRFKYPICRDPGCLRAAAQIQENLDTSISPCVSLWASVCSKYPRNSSGPLDRAVRSQKALLVQKESERIRNLVSTLELPLHTGTVDWKLKHFYEACLDVDAIGIDGHRLLTDIISELGGWYVIRDWNEDDFNGMQVLQMLQVRYGISPFFKVHVEADPHVPDAHCIRISPSGLGLPDKDYYHRDGDDRIISVYTSYIRDVPISLSATSDEATKFGQDMFNYEKRLAEITPDLASLQNPITTYNAVTLAELKLTTNTIPFFDILQAMYPEVSISDDTEVIVTSLEYLNLLAQIISTTDRRTMNGYLIWSLVREYLPFLSEKYTSAMESFNNQLFGISKPLKRWEVCSKLIKTYMPLAAEYHLEKTSPISENTRAILNQTFARILAVVKDNVGKLDDTALLKQHLEVKLDSLVLHVGLPESAKSPEFLKDYYLSLKVMKLNFFAGAKNAIAFRRKTEQKMLLKTLPEEVFLREILREVPTFRYVPSRNAVVAPRSLVMQPFFEDGYPSPILFGLLGVEMASAILSSVLPYGSLWTSDRKILSPFHMTVNESIRLVQPTVDCLSRYITINKSPVPMSRASETALSVLTQLTAVKLAHEALIAASSEGNHTHYGGLEQYEESALYFLSYAQTQCSDFTREYEMYDNLLNFRLPSKSVLDLAWTQLPDFPKAFDCVPSASTRCNAIF